MTITLKNARAVLSATAATVYTCPTGKTAIVLSAQVSNVTAADVATTLQWYDSSAAVLTRLLKDGNVPTGNSLNALSGKQILEAGDYVQGYGAAANALELSMSILEIS